MMLDYVKNRSESSKSYGPFFNNCAYFTRDTLRARGVETKRKMDPNAYYKNITASGVSDAKNEKISDIGRSK